MDFGILEVDGNHCSYIPYHLPYDYPTIETYYKQSDYYKVVGYFAQILLMNLKDNFDYTDEAMKYVFQKAKEENVDTTHGIPNELWNQTFSSYIKSKKLDRFV